MDKTTTTTQQETYTTSTSPSSPEVAAAVVNNEIRHINQTMGRLELKFDEAIKAFVTNDQLLIAQKRADEKHKAQDEKIVALENWNSWAVKIVLGAVLAAALGLVLI